MIRMTGSLLFWSFLAISSLVLFPIGALLWLVSFPFDPRRYVLHRFTSLWASLYTWLNPAWPVRVIGRERLTNGPAVIVANHLSLLDILVLFRLQSHFKWVSKVENFRVPVIGWNMRLCDYIPIRRGDKQSTIAMMRQCDRALAGGSSILMFPEGTRSASGRLRAFNAGAVQIAARNRVPLQPIIVRGTRTRSQAPSCSRAPDLDRDPRSDPAEDFWPRPRRRWSACAIFLKHLGSEGDA
jgi:1-acyl-sn-glycerol-3-phosphate acyltransferase